MKSGWIRYESVVIDFGSLGNSKQMSSVRAIAKQLGLSVATVSRALNNSPDVHPDTLARVLSAASEANYSPTSGKRPKRVIGLLYPQEPVRPGYGDFESVLLGGVMLGLEERRFDLKFVSVSRDKSPAETYTQFFARKGIAGVIVRTFQSSRDMCEAIGAEGFPHVVVADHFNDERVNYVWTDSYPQSVEAVQHLIELGHRRIAIAVHSILDTDHQDRLRAYRDALGQAGIPRDSTLEVSILANPQGGGSAVSRVLSLGTPVTAIVFTDPLATIGALLRCHELGVKVPEQLSIVGFDDSDIRQHTYPTFTAVCQDAGRLGREAALRLTRTLEGEPGVSMRVVLPAKFEMNQSTGPVTGAMFDGSRGVSIGGRGAWVGA